jgi:hypothetical protein
VIPAESETVRRAELALADIADLRAYEREREAFRAHVIALKKRRRVHLGTIVTLVFENRETIRYQIQEMARVDHAAYQEVAELLPATLGELLTDLRG